MSLYEYICGEVVTLLQVVQKQELRATFEKYGIVDEVYIAQAGHASTVYTTVFCFFHFVSNKLKL